MKKIIKHGIIRNLHDREPFLEKFLRKFRISKIRPYIQPADILCDIGCGKHFALLREFNAMFQKCIGIDKKSPTIKYANIDVRNYLLDDKIPLEDESADFITMLAVLEHLDNEEQMIREIKRVLKPGGTLLITVPSKKAERILNFLGYKLHIVSEEELRDHRRYYTAQILDDVLLKNGFVSIKVEPFQFGYNLFSVARKAC